MRACFIFATIYQRSTLNSIEVHCCNLRFLRILYNQRDATYVMYFIIINTLHVSGWPSVHHQEPIKLYVQPWVLSCFPAVYCWCGWVQTHPHQR